MNKKIIVKIIIFVLVVIALIFCINLGRKIFILSTYSNKCNEYANVSNYYIKKNENGTTSEFWRKGNIGLLKLTRENDERMIHFGEDYNWIIVNSKDSKTAVKINKEGGAIEMQSFVSGTLDLNNFADMVKVAFSCRITTEKINNINCYKIDFGKDWQMYIDKENYLLIKEINGSTDTGVIEYKLNTVKDEEVILPNLAGYTINDMVQNNN